MILATWNPARKPRAPFDLYAVERRAGHAIVIAGVWVVRAYFLSRYRAGDVARCVKRRTR